MGLTIQEMSTRGWSFTIQASMLEIYNESVRDLLCDGHPPANAKYGISHDADGNTTVSDLKAITVESKEEVHLDEI